MIWPICSSKWDTLLYADDLVILWRSKTGLQNCLNSLSLNCDKCKLKINPKKTKIMIFQKRPKKSIDIKFNIGSESIEIVQEYTYLGTRLTPTGNFTLALEHLKEKALHAFSSIRKQKIARDFHPISSSIAPTLSIFLMFISVWGSQTVAAYLSSSRTSQRNLRSWSLANSPVDFV